jgi:hypothetical protein
VSEHFAVIQLLWTVESSVFLIALGSIELSHTWKSILKTTVAPFLALREREKL